MGTAATQSDVAAGVEGVLEALRGLRQTAGLTHGVDVALEGAEVCLVQALARAPASEVVDEAKQ
jgi:hypothetical protein